jgi:hypothetical protein
MLGETTLTDTTSTGEDDPLLLEWSQLLPGFTPGHDPSSSNECKKGHVNCVEKIIREMERRVARNGCDHNSLFGLAYLRTTQHYLVAWREPGFFSDPASSTTTTPCSPATTSTPRTTGAAAASSTSILPGASPSPPPTPGRSPAAGTCSSA